MNLKTAVRPDLASGIWKFSSSISQETVFELGKRLLEQYPDRILELSVRGCGRDQYGLEGKFKLNGEGKKSFQKFFHQAREKLQEEFGEDHVRWDISSPVWILK